MNGGKRLFDLFFSLIGLIVLTPLFLAVAGAIKIDDQGPVFFRQERVGRRGKIFLLWKFRTMLPEGIPAGEGCRAANIFCPSPQLTVGDDPRITRAGRFLRRAKIDELPQLINVLKGEMSLVGPRPEVPRYVALYTEEQRRVLELTPGITDPASIRYRHESSLLALSADPEQTYIQQIMPEKLRLNLDYARRATCYTDFKVILTTLRLVLKADPSRQE